MFPKISNNLNHGSLKKSGDPSIVSLPSLPHSSTAPVSTRLFSLQIFNSKTTIKDLYQEKEINQRIRRKLDTKISNPEQDQPKSRQSFKNQKLTLSQNQKFLFDKMNLNLNQSSKKITSSVVNSPQRYRIFERIPKNLEPIVHCFKQKIKKQLEIGSKPKSFLKNIYRMTHQKEKITDTVGSIKIQDHSFNGKNLILVFTNQIKASIQKFNEEDTNFGHWLWPYLLSKFHRYHLNDADLRELLTQLKSLIQTNFEHHEDQKTNQLCQKHGYKFHQLENSLFFRHIRAFEYLKFMATRKNHPEFEKDLLFRELKFDLSEQETQKVAAKVRFFFQSDMSSFAFLSLYLQMSVTKKILKATLSKTVKKYNQIINRLEKVYPASSSKNNQMQLKEKKELQDLLKKLEFGKFNYQMEKIVYNNKTSHYDQLEKFILQKAEVAAKNKSQFTAFVKKIVHEKGYGFKVGVKIQGSNQKQSLFRTIEKIYETEAPDAQINPIEEDSQKLIGDKLKAMISRQKKETEEKIQRFFDEHTETNFSAKDLLRGKCTFDTVEDIYKTAMHLLQKISEAKNNGQEIDLIELKDRLSKNTKDLVTIIKFGESIAEFQFALKLDSVSNEFNHKIYELKRSKLYSPIVNLFVQNEKWSQQFFTKLMELYEGIAKIGEGFQSGQIIKINGFINEIDEFKQKILTKNEINFQKTEDYKINETKETKILYTEFLSFIASKKDKHQKLMKFNGKKIHQASFLKAIFDYTKTIDVLNQLNQTELMNSEELLEIKAVILKKKGHSRQAIELYEILIRVKTQRGKDEFSAEFANIFYELGSCNQEKGEYSKALEHYKKCLEIRTKVKGAESIDIAATLNHIGIVYQQKGEYEKALEHYNKSLEIKTKVKGADSIDVAVTLNNIGIVYKEKEDYSKALEHYSKCLEIKTKVKGADSIDVAGTLNNIGSVYQEKGEYKKALQHYSKCLDIETKIKGADSIDVAGTLNNIGTVYKEKEDYSKAMENYSKCLEIETKIKGSDSIDVAETLENIGNVYQAKGEYKQALERYSKCLEIKTKVKGADSIDVAVTLNNIGTVYQEKEEYKKALEHYAKSLEIFIRVNGGNCANATVIQSNIQLVNNLIAGS